MSLRVSAGSLEAPPRPAGTSGAQLRCRRRRRRQLGKACPLTPGTAGLCVPAGGLWSSLSLARLLAEQCRELPVVRAIEELHVVAGGLWEELAQLAQMVQLVQLPAPSVGAGPGRGRSAQGGPCSTDGGRTKLASHLVHPLMAQPVQPQPEAPQPVEPQWQPLQGRTCPQPAAGAASAQPGLLLLLECATPLASEIAGFLCSPDELARLTALATSFVTPQNRATLDLHWERLYAEKWPVFHDCMQHAGTANWQSKFRETLSGRRECVLEVFNRGMKLGFAMSALPARVRWDSRSESYIARYLSISESTPEIISGRQPGRFRFCPLAARNRLSLGSCDLEVELGQSKAREAPAARGTRTEGEAPEMREGDRELRGCHGERHVSSFRQYPYRVLVGTEGLRVGRPVELQWKMQLGSPFGWWYGVLESLELGPEALSGAPGQGAPSTATIVFPHFPPNSRWYQLTVQFGDGCIRHCSMGGYSGGLRGVTESECDRWARFFPSEPIDF